MSQTKRVLLDVVPMQDGRAEGLAEVIGDRIIEGDLVDIGGPDDLQIGAVILDEGLQIPGFSKPADPSRWPGRHIVSVPMKYLVVLTLQELERRHG